MRKLSSGNKKSFVLFSIIIIGIIAILIGILSLVLKIPKEEYIIEGDNFLYDEDYNPIQLEQEAIIQKKWTGKYYLKNSVKDEEYNLGKQCIAYQEHTKTLNLYGDMYRIYTDGTVENITKNTTITKTSEDQLYKLGDRKYLVVGNLIANQNGALNTSGYLLVLLDKAGNTYLLNNELNSKTIKPMIIKTQTFEFDVANEKLIYEEKEIDLKKIIGSTNQYKEKKEEEKEDNQFDKITAIIQNINTQTTINNNQSSTTNNNTIINNQQNNTNININTDNNGKPKEDLDKSVQLKRTSATSNYIDVEYSIIDPENKYQTVYILVEGNNGISKTIALDKAQTMYRVNNLPSNKEYKITLATKQINEDGEVEETIEDITVARTTRVNSTLKITKITSKELYFELLMDKNQNIDGAEIVLYIDTVEKDRIPVNVEKAVSAEGWTGTLKYESGQNIVLKVENATYNGEQLQLNIQAKAKNY